MKKNFNLFILIVLTSIQFSFTSDTGYDPSLVEISMFTYNGDKFIMVNMKRDGNRIKVKYFAATDPTTGKTVPERYKSWALGKNIICFSSGTYMNSCEYYDNPSPVGLCIDNGVNVNKSLQDDLGGLVVVYASGGVATARLSDGNLTIKMSSGDKTVDIKNNSFDRIQFINWAVQNESTVFQAHLLAYNDKLDIKYCASDRCQKLASRRFLAVCKDQNDKIIWIFRSNRPLYFT